MSKHTGVIVGADDTDHIAFFCPKCGQTMHVTHVENNRKVPDTHIYLSCSCGETGWRKFYHFDPTNGKYCTHRTDGEPPRPPLTDSVGKGLTRADVIEGLRETYSTMLTLEQEKDPTLSRYPDMEKILDYIEAHGLPPK